MPNGVRRGLGWQKSPALVSTGIKELVSEEDGGVYRGSDAEIEDVEDWPVLQAEAHSAEEAIAIAVDILCAITQPTIFSRSEADVAEGRRNR